MWGCDVNGGTRFARWERWESWDEIDKQGASLAAQFRRAAALLVIFFPHIILFEC